MGDLACRQRCGDSPIARKQDNMETSQSCTRGMSGVKEAGYRRTGRTWAVVIDCSAGLIHIDALPTERRKLITTPAMLQPKLPSPRAPGFWGSLSVWGGCAAAAWPAS
jgi:hypothetical protein